MHAAVIMTSQSYRVFSRNRMHDITSVTHTHTDRTKIKVIMIICTDSVTGWNGSSTTKPCI